MQTVITQLLEVAKPDEVLRFYGGKTDLIEEDAKQSSQMEKRKAAIVEALFVKANLLLDEHIKISTQDIPKVFRDGIQLPKADKGKPKPSGDKASGAAASLSSASVTSTTAKDEATAASVETQLMAVDDETTPQNCGPQSAAVSEAQRISLSEANQAFREFIRWVESTDEKALLLTAKQAVASTRYGTALRCLNKIVEEKSTSAGYFPIERAIIDVSSFPLSFETF